MLLRGKTALITGENVEISSAIAQSFINEGAKVAIAAKSLEKLHDIQKKLGEHLLIFHSDVTKLHDLNHLASQSYKALGSLDILVASAGLYHHIPFEHTTEESFDHLISSNLKGVFFTVQRISPYLHEGGSIILIASLLDGKKDANFSATRASKAAVTSLAQSFAAELMARKIRVNSISPGAVHATVFNNRQNMESTAKNASEHQSSKQSTYSKEVVGAALFLASDQSSYVTATDISVDAGVCHSSVS